MTLIENLFSAIEKTPDKNFLQFQQERISYGQLYERVGQVSFGLHEIGVREGDKVCLMIDNCPEYIDAWFALSYLKAVTVPVNVHLKGEGLRYIMDHSDCTAIIVDDTYLPNIASAITKMDRAMKVIVREIDKAVREIENKKHLSFSELINLNTWTWIERPQTSATLNSILYTSGTTGLPKGVMISENAFLHSAQLFADQMCQINSADILFTTLPLFHVNAQTTTVLGSIHANATIALSNGFSASQFWDEIRAHDATIFNSLGSMIPILCKQQPRKEDKQHRVRLTACAATPKEFWSPFEQRFGVKIVEGYGLTETTGFCISNPLHANRPPSFGKPYPNIDVKIVDEYMQEVEAGIIGEIIIHTNDTPILMDGYYKMDKQTRETIKDGWFRTGDRGYQDEDGYFYFSNRMKECIRRRGENISSWEIEQVVNNHPSVLESAAVGVPSDVGEEDVKIYIVLLEGTSLSPIEILDWCQDRMAYFMVPRYVEFVDEFPKTPTERIQKYKLAEKGIGDAWDREKAGYKVRKS